MSAEEQYKYIIIWKTENVNFCRAHKDYLLSPKFTAKTIYNFMTEWILRLDILRKNNDIDSLRVTLKRLDSEPDTVTVNIHMLIVIPGHSDQELGKMEHTSFSKDQEQTFSTSHLDFKASRLFLDNMLTIRCNIFKSSREFPLYMKYFARTRVGIERGSGPLSIKKFSSNNPVLEHYFLSKDSNEKLIVKSFNWLPNGFLSFDIGRNKAVKAELLKVIGNISIIHEEKSKIISEESSYCFSFDMDIWNFQIPVTKSSLQSYLFEDDLFLLCDFIFFTKDTSEIVERVYMVPPCTSPFENQTENETHEENSVFKPVVLTDFKNLYEQKIHTDLVLCAGNLSIPCHRAILCSRSPVFKAMFDSEMKEKLTKKVEIPDIDGDILHRFLLYVYSETLEQMDWDIAKKLLYAANKYEIQSLISECSSFLQSHLTTSNICEALELADMYHDHGIKLACVDFVFKHANEVFASNVWKEFTVKQPLLSAETFQKYFSSKT